MYKTCVMKTNTHDRNQTGRESGERGVKMIKVQNVYVPIAQCEYKYCVSQIDT